jgi:hypothetical protein
MPNPSPPAAFFSPPRSLADTPPTISTHRPTAAVPGVQVVDWVIPDPHGQSVDAVRTIRDAIRGRILELAAERGWALRPAGAATRVPAPAAALAVA